MECPNCHKQGNALKRIFSKRKGMPNRYCVYCNAEVKVNYNWSKISLLAAGIFVVLIILNYVLQTMGWPGITGGFAGGLAGAIIAVYMRKPPFMQVELIKPSRKKRRN